MPTTLSNFTDVMQRTVNRNWRFCNSV